MNDFIKFGNHKYLFLDSMLENEDGLLIFKIEIGKVSKVEEEIKIGSKSLSGYPIEIDSDLPLIVVEFDDYINYSVTNESFANYDSSKEYEGEKFRVYTNSDYLDFIKIHTFATADFPGEYKHYNILCENHTINVASTMPPKVYEVIRSR